MVCTPLRKGNGTFSYMWKFSDFFVFFKFPGNIRYWNRIVDKHISYISIKFIETLNIDRSLNIAISWFFDFELEYVLHDCTELAWILIFPEKAPCHIHRSLTAQNYTDYSGCMLNHTLITIRCQIELSQIAKLMWPTWGPPGSYRPQVGPMLAPWTLLSGVFMHAGATFHAARISQECRINVAIYVLLWPAYSPDINTIENVWPVIFRRIYGMIPLPWNADELCAACTWNGRT